MIASLLSTDSWLLRYSVAKVTSRCLLYFLATISNLHKHGVSILSSVNFCKTFRRIYAVWKTAQT